MLTKKISLGIFVGFTNERSFIVEAFRLKEKNGGSEAIYFVFKIDDRIIGHAYYVTESRTVLNQKDNGYGRYPVLSYDEIVR